jgi:hypothetical protein
MQIEHHSPSSLNLFCASPAMYCLEKIVGVRQPVGAPAHRGTAVEHGTTHGLLSLDAPIEDCVAVALEKFDTVSALSADGRREAHRDTIPGMVENALRALRPYGKPTSCQGYIEWRPEGLALPIVGYCDYRWDQHGNGIIVDLKTSERIFNSVKTEHARQISFYADGNATGRVCYVSPHKHTTFRVENLSEHREALRQIALRVERFMELSDDPQFYLDITAPDLQSPYWSGPTARQLAYEHWRI